MGQPADQVPAFSGKLSPGNDRKREASRMVMAGTWRAVLYRETRRVTEQKSAEVIVASEFFNRKDMVKGRTQSREEPVILEKAMSPTGGAIIFGVLAVANLVMQSGIWLCSKTFKEPPRADPHAGWCGEREKLPLTRLEIFYNLLFVDGNMKAGEGRRAIF